MNRPVQLPVPVQRPAGAGIEPVRAFALAFVVAALFALTSRYPGYVHHDTAEIAMWSTLGWPLGLPKHPPFLPWLFRACGTLVPLNWVTIGLLTAANITLGAWAVWRIAVATIGQARGAVALLLYAIAPAGTFLALKLNHNAILVSLWPLTMLAFLACLRSETVSRSVASGVMFGALAAASMLAKYYSGVLLVCCFAASLVSRRRNRFYAMPGGYIAVAVFLALVAPHVWWLFDNRGATLAYAFHETEREADPLLHFLLVAPAYLGPPLAGFLALRRWGDGPPGWAGADRGTALLPELKVLAFGPFLITALFITVFKLRGATSWSLPDFSVVPVLLALALPSPDAARLTRVKRLAGRGLGVIAVAGPFVLLAAFLLGDGNTVEPRAEFARAGAAIFAAAAGRQPRIVAGDPQSANTAALEVPSRPVAFTNFNPAFAPWVTPDSIGRDGVLVICRPSYAGCAQAAMSLAKDRPGFSCRLTRRRTYLGLTARPFAAEVTIILPAGVVKSNPELACAAGEGFVLNTP